ncbi:hypothetical protein ISF6_3269 [Piscinibacter sakaiensis]|uniref:Uncharacterized protein n=1 Tax=Piscinibacter sakaiensis TaxID=1547922 RepID=A0A0K8P4D6_PISS1|nr:hypothetical protein ISF6_3269 [Piscinibacter sakaiensis]
MVHVMVRVTPAVWLVETVGVPQVQLTKGKDVVAWHDATEEVVVDDVLWVTTVVSEHCVAEADESLPV